MGLIGEIYQKWKQKREEAIKERQDIPDDVTTDRYLRSLRRQRRIQLEEFEKAKLLKDIRQHEVDRANNHLWGIVKAKKNRKLKEMLTARYNFSGQTIRKRKRQNLFRI